eukprot:20821-Heterococcus_DN1.PRE.3
MEARGEPVVSLCVGEPDFPPPPAVIEATIEWLHSDCILNALAVSERTRRTLLAQLHRCCIVCRLAQFKAYLVIALSPVLPVLILHNVGCACRPHKVHWSHRHSVTAASYL